MTDQDCPPPDEHEDERWNPGKNTQGTGGVGATPPKYRKPPPLDPSSREQAGTQRDPAHPIESGRADG